MKYYTNLVPGTTYGCTVGDGGDENYNGSGMDGTESNFYGPTTLTATGGEGGAASSASGYTSNGGQGTGADINGSGGKGYYKQDGRIGAGL